MVPPMKSKLSTAQRQANVVLSGVKSGAINLSTFSMSVTRFAFCFGASAATAQEVLWILADAQVIKLVNDTYVMA